MDDFNKFAAKEGELLESVYERLTTLVNIMDRNNVRPISVSINTKFLNCLQPEWSKYVTMSHASQSYSNSPQPYYVTHPSSVVDYEEDYQGKLQGAVTEPNYDPKAVSKVNVSHIMIPKWVHEHKNNGKRKTVVNTSDDDQIDSNIIFDDPYVENNDGSDKHDSNVHDQYHDVKIMAYNVQREAENQK
ncbi:hypothetical protein Tco_1519404 [Tanacetum coccineum]